MKKSFMSNIRNFVDSNVRQRIDRVAHNNNEFFSDELLLVERQYEDLRYICLETEKRISSLLQSVHSSTIGTYTQNVQAGINNLSQLTSSNSINTSISKQNESLGGASGGLNNNSQHSHQSCSQSASGSKSQLVSSSFSSSSTQAANVVSTQRNDAASNTIEPHDIHPNDSVRTFTEELTNGIQQKYKKLPIVGFLKFLLKSSNKLRPGSPLAITLTHCSQLQTQLTELYLGFEQTIDIQCLRPIRTILENDIPNVAKLRKSFIKSHNDLESAQSKYNVVCQKQQQQQSQTGHHSSSNSYTIVSSNSNNSQMSSINKLDQLKKELDEALSRFEQAKDVYESELYAFVCRETELADLIAKFYSYHLDYHQQVNQTIQFSLPTLRSSLSNSHRKAIFGTPLEEHLRCTGRNVSPVIELCTHLLYVYGLNEEGLFRIPGSSVKIKKLKNAINAWFITLSTSSHESERSQNQDNGQSSVIAIYDLFKTIVVKHEQTFQHQSSPEIVNNQSATMALNRYDQSNSANNSATTTEDSFDTMIDVHTVAGLLKLYLRELSEPLLTYANYNQWIEAIRKPLTNDDRLEVLGRTVQQLPQCNQDNLKHLLRFLNLLNSHKESNKMTASNLAIAIAPSLIWSRPQVVACPSNTENVGQQQGVAGNINYNADNSAQAFSMQMSSFGMSASLHALILESLINHADKLFPGPVDFSLAEFKGLLRASSQRLDCKTEQYHQNRLKSKSTSPTGLSTASSSSLSSGSSSTTSASVSQQQQVPSSTSTKIMTHSRKGGSMDGLLNHDAPLSSAMQQTRQPPPPVPPMPSSRGNISIQQQVSSVGQRSKPVAPPVPPPVGSRSSRARPCSIAVGAGESLASRIESVTSPEPCSQVQPKSLRGTGNISIVGTSSPTPLPSPIMHPNSTRPSVPPPERPTQKVSTPESPTQDHDANVVGPKESLTEVSKIGT